MTALNNLTAETPAGEPAMTVKPTTLAPNSHRIMAAMAVHRATSGGLLLRIAAIGAAIFVIQVSFAWLAADAVENTSNATLPIFLSIFFFVGMNIAIAQGLPFALSLGLTRRDFVTASVLYYVALIVGATLVSVAFGAVELATDGWGTRYTFFTALSELPIPTAASWLLLFAVVLAFTMSGILTGSIYSRWGQTGMWAAAIVTMILAGGTAAFITWQKAWPAVMDALAAPPLAVLLICTASAVAAVTGTVGYLIVRRSPF